MSLAEMAAFVVVILQSFISTLTSVSIGGIPLLWLMVTFTVMGFLMVIVFRVEVGGLFDNLHSRIYKGKGKR